jgi:aspartyl-tRNA(Asn)/glutamyl-tRNA(Gln) amidotransferase subunit A
LRIGVVEDWLTMEGIQDGVRDSVRAGIERLEKLGASVDVARLPHADYALSAGYYDAYYGQAQKVRTLVIRDFDQAFERFDLVVGPTSPTTAFRLGERTEDPLAMYLSDVFTIPSDLSGTPAISIPCGLADDGLPVGFQIMGRLRDEATVLRAAYALEQDLAFKDRPKLLAGLQAS